MLLKRVQLSVLSLTFALQACGGATPTDAQLTAYAEKPPPIGAQVEFFMYTHCGVESARIGGRWWHVTEPFYGEGNANPPPGWDNPYQEGELVLESPVRAVFEARGEQVVLMPASTNEPLRICS